MHSYLKAWIHLIIARIWIYSKTCQNDHSQKTKNWDWIWSLYFQYQHIYFLDKKGGERGGRELPQINRKIQLYFYLASYMYCHIRNEFWYFQVVFKFNPFPASHYFWCLLAHLLMFLGSLYICIANKGAVWSGFIVFAFIIKSSLKCTWNYATDIKSRQHCQDKKIFAG